MRHVIFITVPIQLSGIASFFVFAAASRQATIPAY
jgi:hypothetical protein